MTESDAKIVKDLLSRELMVSVFVTKGEGRISNWITKITNAEYSHTGIVFHAGTSAYYYEALMGKGFHGPRHFNDLMDWSRENDKRKLQIKTLPQFSSEEVKYMLGRATTLEETSSYAEWQLVQFLLMKKLRVPMRRSHKKVICSEAVSRIMYPIVDLPKDLGLQHHDAVSPQDIINWA